MTWVESPIAISGIPAICVNNSLKGDRRQEYMLAGVKKEREYEQKI